MVKNKKRGAFAPRFLKSWNECCDEYHMCWKEESETDAASELLILQGGDGARAATLPRVLERVERDAYGDDYHMCWKEDGKANTATFGTCDAKKIGSECRV